MRRFFRFFAALLVALVLLAACASSSSSPPSNGLDPVVSGLEPQPSGAQLALIGTEERLADSFGQGVWSAISKFAGEAGLTCAPYKTAAGTAEAILSTLELAAKGNAGLIVSIDPAVSRAVKDMAWKYPDVSFILLDEQDPVATGLRDNTVLVGYSAAQAGWLAGYVALYEHPEAVRLAESGSRLSQEYALGFLLGAEAAAAEKRLAAGSVPVARLGLDGELSETELAEQLASFFGGEENADAGPVFIADSGVQRAALAGARAAGSRVIGIELNMETAGAAALASIRFDAKNLVAGLLAAWDGGSFPGGGIHTGGAADGSILLNTTPFRLKNLSEAAAQNLAATKFGDGSLARSLARSLAPAADGSLPTAETLDFEYLNLFPQSDEEDPTSTETSSGASLETPPESTGEE